MLRDSYVSVRFMPFQFIFRFIFIWYRFFSFFIYFSEIIEWAAAQSLVFFFRFGLYFNLSAFIQLYI